MDSVVEIGALHGRSTLALLTGCKGPVYAVDPWDDEGEFCYPSFMASCGHMPNLRPVKGYSPQVAADLPDVDMVFLDGAHDEASVVADIEAWLPKCRRLLCGHDYVEDGGFPDVFPVVNRYFGDRVTVAKNTAIWAVNVQADD
jgi:precorrin-6B methylase 2